MACTTSASGPSNHLSWVLTIVDSSSILDRDFDTILSFTSFPMVVILEIVGLLSEPITIVNLVSV